MPSFLQKYGLGACSPLSKRRIDLKNNSSDTTKCSDGFSRHQEADEVIQGKREYFYTCEEIDSIYIPKPNDGSNILVKFEESDLIEGNHRLVTKEKKIDPRNLPFNEPAKENVFEFETSLFSGKCLLRFKNLPNQCPKYFKGRKRKQQWILQGTFKKEIRVSDVMSGYELKVPAKRLPGKFIVKPILGLIRNLAPTMKDDLFGKQPYVYNPLLQTIQTLDVSLPGNEPDITNISILENNYLLFLTSKDQKKKIKKCQSSKERKKYFSSVNHGRQHYFQPGYVYTFEFYEDKVDISTFKFTVPLISVDLKRHLGMEPIPIMAKVMNDQSSLNGKYLFRFDIFHKKQLEQRKQAGINFMGEKEKQLVLS